VAKGLGEVAADTELANGMIVLVNTVIAIAMTVGIGYYLANHSRAKSTSDTQVEAFTGYGVTVLLFLFGEMVPKQMALSARLKQYAEKLGRGWVAFLYLIFFPYFIALGIVDTFRLILD
jgi:CBS domain containing-hemolysin-like protein